MGTGPAILRLQHSIGPDAASSRLHDAAAEFALEAAPLRLRRALGQSEDYKRALTASQQESSVAKRQVDLLPGTNAHLKDISNRGVEVIARDTPGRSSWRQTDTCLSAGPDPVATRIVGRILALRTRFRRGDVIYRAGGIFDALYAIRYGSCKRVLLGKSGEEQVAAYHMFGEIIGMDGIADGRHQCQAIALEDLEVARLPFDKIEDLARLSEQFAHDVHTLLAREGAHAHAVLLVLGTMRAEQRLAVFLLDLSDRYQARGYSPYEFVLRMTRQEIGSYLGLTLETVSRLFSRFHREGMLQVEGRNVKLLDRIAVTQLVDCSA